MHERINVTLPEETIALIDRTTEKGDRSGLINDAVRHYIEWWGKKNLSQRLKEGALARAERDLSLVEDF